MLGSLKQAIDAIFAEHESRCLWFSGGSDSRLLLEVVLETEKPFGILTFGDGWTREQRKSLDAVILEKNLQVFSFPAVSHLFVGEGEDISVVSQYAIDGYGNTAMLVKDLVDDPERCVFDIKMEAAKQRAAVVDWDVHIWGLRFQDRHWVNGDEPLITGERQWIGSKEFLFPLAGWTREDVIAALKTYGIDWQEPSDTEDGGNIVACSLCLKGETVCPKTNLKIPQVEWNPAENMKQVRNLLALSNADAGQTETARS